MYMHLRLKCLCAKTFCTQCFFCKILLSDRKSFLACRTAKMSWRTSRIWDRLISARMRWKQLRRTYFDDMWEEMGWDEKSWDEVRRAHVIWGEIKCRVRSASVKCEVQGVKSAVLSVRKVIAWRCIAPGSRAGHVPGQQHCNSFAQSTHARAWLAHGACKFYRWKRSYSISPRQLPPRLVRVLLIQYIYI